MLYIGAVEERRNPEFLIDLVKNIERTDIGLVIIGKGPKLPTIIDKIKRNCLGNKVLTFESVPNKI